MNVLRLLHRRALAPRPSFAASGGGRRCGPAPVLLWGLALLGGGCEPAPPSRPQGEAAGAEPAPASPGSEPAAAANEADARLISELRLETDRLAKVLAEKGEIVVSRPEPAGPPAADEPSDRMVQGRVLTRLHGDPDVPAMLLAVEAASGQVTLTGRVANLKQLQKALLAAVKAQGVKSIIARVTVEADDGSGSVKVGSEAPADPPRSK